MHYRGADFLPGRIQGIWHRRDPGRLDADHRRVLGEGIERVPRDPAAVDRSQVSHLPIAAVELDTDRLEGGELGVVELAGEAQRHPRTVAGDAGGKLRRAEQLLVVRQASDHRPQRPELAVDATQLCRATVHLAPRTVDVVVSGRAHGLGRCRRGE